MMIWNVFGFIVLFGTYVVGKDQELANAIEDGKDLLILTVATRETDGFNRYLRSAKVYNLNGKVLGMGEPWKGGDIKNKPGGGFKVNLLKEELKNHKDDNNLIIMFTDSYDVLLLADKTEILNKFESFGANVVFGAEDFCWPDQGLKDEYPKVERGYRFLNSGGFIGYAKDIFGIVNETAIQDEDDDQLYYTKIFLDEALRSKYNIKLDHTAKLFQNLNGAVSDIELKFRDAEPFLENTIHNTQPAVVHGNGPSKLILNYLGNYIPKAWNTVDHCTSCREDNHVFETFPEIPHVVIAVFIERPTPFLEEFLNLVAAIDYPKAKIDLFIHNNEEFHVEDVEDFVQIVTADAIVNKYHSVKVVGPKEKASEWLARTMGLDFCSETKCDFYFSLDSEAHIDNPLTLKQLINQNRNVVAPMLVRPYKAWSNFWGALNPEEFYARGTDYMDIVMDRRRGLWNVPYVASAYLIKGPFILNEETRPSFVFESLDPDMAFCKNLREKGDFFYVSNRFNWGHLVSTDDFTTTHLNNELWEIESNKYDWELRYLHKNYSQSLEENAVIAQPCPDVYWFPIVSNRFADELVEEMEHFGKWSDGSNQDNRLQGGYENVPTRDIHMNQVGFEKHWLHLLDTYVRPLQEKVFLGYFHSDTRIEGGYENVPTRDIHMKQIDFEDHWLNFLNTYVRPLQEKAFLGYVSEPPRSLMNFVVRYRPDEQPFLRPHHDSSTYTINVALNRAGVDYEGGGCRFLRYNCSLTDTKKGWMLMHPGRLTHYHEGLRDPLRAYMFVVRYRPDEQPSLRPHHDTSTYTINLALNRAGIDYEGGGCSFPRYNCSVRDTRKGWLVMHPGTLTHLHEGLPTTRGTRYIQVSFIDP